jgi:Mn-dependent DtxR family transcriptional regulator
MLLEIKRIVQERERMTLRELSVHFDVTSDTLEPMLDKLVQKGQIRVVNVRGCTTGCAGCSCADRDQMIVYEWSFSLP